MIRCAFTHRSAAQMMGLARARAVLPDALSFPRAAMRELVRGRYRVEKLRFELDADGRGEILYRLHGGGRVFHFFLVSDLLPEEQKTDRNYAASWDAMGVMCQGEWTPQREALLRREVPRQRAGFADYGTLMYARGNRSTRIFNHVVDSLAQGRQPDLQVLAPVGYILRTTAFIGNGQLGTLPLDGYGPDHPLRRPYHAQFCSAFLLREYVFDLVDHLARIRNPQAARLAPEYRRFLGLGNSAATGLAAYATNHPQQMHRWSLVHEDALVEAVRRMPELAGAMAQRFTGLLDKAVRHFTEGERPHDGVFASPQDTAAQLRRVQLKLQQADISSVSASGQETIALERLLGWAHAQVQPEACEALLALVLELHPDIAEAAVDRFLVQEEAVPSPEARAGDLLGLVEREFEWAIHGDMADLPAQDEPPEYFWYRSSSAPRDVRRGLRRRVAHLEFETNMDFALQLREVHRLLRTMAPGAPVAGLLCERPDLRHAIARLQSLQGARYSELRQPWLSARYTPFEATRFVLAFYGMEKFEAAFPKSVRGTFMQGAPIAEDVAAGRAGRWPFTTMPEQPGTESELAPLPANAGRAVAVSAAEQAPQPQLLRLAPKELARALQTALQGHGMPLGVAEEAGVLAAFAQQCGQPAVQAALRHCADDRVAPFAFPGAAQSWPEQGDALVLHGRSASALAVAPAALDLAIERCLRPSRDRASVLIVQAQDAWLLGALALRGARKGLLTVLLWRAADAAGGVASGYAMAGPQDGGAWYADGPIDTAGAAVVHTLAQSPGWASLQAQGFMVTCLRPGAMPAAGAAPAEPVRTDTQMASQAASEGIELRRTDYEALLKAGAALLVPRSVEHLVLHEGFDPLKSF